MEPLAEDHQRGAVLDQHRAVGKRRALRRPAAHPAAALEALLVQEAVELPEEDRLLPAAGAGPRGAEAEGVGPPALPAGAMSGRERGGLVEEEVPCSGRAS
jgi:hypothetical protein